MSDLFGLEGSLLLDRVALLVISYGAALHHLQVGPRRRRLGG